MRRIYFLVADIDIARRIVDELLLARVEERHVHVLAKRGTPLEDLPEATFFQKTDFVPALEHGVAVGAPEPWQAWSRSLCRPAWCWAEGPC